MSALSNYGDLKEALDIYGLDLEDGEDESLLNEGYIKLATQSGWNRATLDFTAVTDQEFYPLPESVYDIRQVFVGGRPYGYQDEKTVRRIEDTALTLRGNGIFWQTFNADAEEGIGLYPTVEEGTAIAVIAVVRPEPLTEDEDVPSAVPPEFRRGIIDYAAAQSYNVEDNVELRSFYQTEFDRTVSELKQMRLTRVQSGPVQVRVVGVHV